MTRIIVAFDENRGIGYQGRVLWCLHEDLRHFRETTIGHTVVMGRLTWESIGRPLPNRRNIVVSRTLTSLLGAECVGSLGEALALAGGDAFIIGGQELYVAALPVTDVVLASQVKGVYLADRFFPALDPALWQGKLVQTFNGFDLWAYERRREQ